MTHRYKVTVITKLTFSAEPEPHELCWPWLFEAISRAAKQNSRESEILSIEVRDENPEAQA